MIPFIPHTRRSLVDLTTLILLLPVLFILGGYILYPSLRTLGQSFWREGHLSLIHYRTFFDPAHPANLEALWHSLYISLGSVLLSGLIGVPLAFIFTRYDFPGRRLFAALALLPMALPPLVGVLSFYFLYGESGLIPRGLQALLHLERVPFAIDGVAAVLAVHAYTMYPYYYLFVAGALQGLDSAVEEAALNLGASPGRVLMKVLLPLLTPALVGASLLVFMTSMASFSAPYIFASSYRVLSVQIYHSKVNNQMELAVTQTVVLSLFSILFLLVLRWYSGRRQYIMVGKGVARLRRPLGRGWRRWLLGIGGILAVLILLLPHLTILLMSFVKDGTWTWQVLPPEYTLENYTGLAQAFAEYGRSWWRGETAAREAEGPGDRAPWLRPSGPRFLPPRLPRLLKPVVNSLWMATVATAGNGLFGLLVAYLLTKRKFRGKAAVEVMAMLPWALPGTVIAMNLLVVFNQPTWLAGGKILAGTVWLLPLAYFIRHIPLVVRSTHAALEQLDDSLAEAARNLGATGLYAFRRVTLPLIGPGVLAGTLLAYVAALGEFVSSIMLYTVHNRPISIEILAKLRDFHFGSAAAYSVLLTFLIAGVLWFSHSVLKVQESPVV